MTDSSDSITTEVDAIAARALAGGWHLAVAESLTGGELAARLARGKNADEWFRGGIVAYQPRVKAELLGVDGPLHRSGREVLPAFVAAEMSTLDRPRTVVLVTHRREALSVCDRVYDLEARAFVERGPLAGDAPGRQTRAIS